MQSACKQPQSSQTTPPTPFPSLRVPPLAASTHLMVSELLKNPKIKTCTSSDSSEAGDQWEPNETRDFGVSSLFERNEGKRWTKVKIQTRMTIKEENPQISSSKAGKQRLKPTAKRGIIGEQTCKEKTYHTNQSTIHFLTKIP